MSRHLLCRSVSIAEIQREGGVLNARRFLGPTDLEIEQADAALARSRAAVVRAENNLVTLRHDRDLKRPEKGDEHADSLPAAGNDARGTMAAE